MAQADWTTIFEDKVALFKRGHSWRLEFDGNLVPKSPKRGWKEYIRNTCAWFRCRKCGRSWPSNRVMVVFHMCLIGREGVVKVRRFRQNCKKCPSAPMEKPKILPENIDILMDNLVKKIRIKCYGERLDGGFRPPQNLEVRSPHEPAHCEACQLGICERNTATNNPST
ncbi:receptor-transporting protein 3-like [Acanthopagrus latus]|uniref:receptor-transporting protein 3-like n=1 Tax=Acanthopagrus latus TaxID=8177 RepID=UPI00187CFB72|nr:receptor-transporting protein 3-like [Acanthopagrus latus]